MLYAAASVLLASVAAQSSDQSVSIDSRIAAVDVYPNTALVTRVGQIPAGDGRYVVRGLPASADADSVRLRAPGSEIVRLEVLRRVERAVPEDRIAEATTELEGVRAELERLADELEVLEALTGHFTTLLTSQAQGEAALGMTDEERLASIQMVRTQLTELAAERRALADEHADLDARRTLLLERIADWKGGGTTTFQDVALHLIDTDGDADEFELDYLVGDARWSPYYEVRADSELSGVDLVFRARVHQRTGEDWKDAHVALSTARPRRQLSPPEPRIRWIDVWNPKARSGGAVTSDAAPSEEADFEVGFASDDALTERASSGRWADIRADGVNLRYVLPTAQTIPSRSEPSSVLIGRDALDVEMERVCLPELGETVWLRGRATNTTPWVLLEGDASVFLGSTFLGRTPIARVQTGETFDVPLGEDPTITVERIETEREVDEAGFISSTDTLRTTHRIKLVNTSEAGGTKRVIVHESVPRATSDSVEVKIDRVSPALATGERWEELRTERGVVTWVLDMGPGAERTLELRLAIGYPESRRISIR